MNSDITASPRQSLPCSKCGGRITPAGDSTTAASRVKALCKAERQTRQKDRLGSVGWGVSKHPQFFIVAGTSTITAFFALDWKFHVETLPLRILLSAPLGLVISVAYCTHLIQKQLDAEMKEFKAGLCVCDSCGDLQPGPTALIDTV